MDLTEKLRNFKPWNQQESTDLAVLIQKLQNDDTLLFRENKTEHLTASAWIVSSDKKQILMAHHNIYNSWAWLGGHADGNADLLSVAIQEAQEESGIQNIRPLSEEIFSIEILAVNGHKKRGEYIPSHLHLNVTFLLEADSSALLQSKADENSRVAWFSPEDAVRASSEPWFQTHIYAKLNEKLADFLEKSVI